MALHEVETVIFLMLENRSFDHLLGYLSLDETEDPLPVDGLRSDPAWQAKYTNVANGKRYPLKKLASSPPVRQDPPHGSEAIAKQINTAPVGPGVSQMGGFAESYAAAHESVDNVGAVMGYHDAHDVPVYDFLARNFTVCDRWFCSLPLGTQANRLMSMAGESRVFDNVIGLPPQSLVYDWLTSRKVSWRTYVSGGYAPFFIMMRRWSLRILKSLALGRGNFRRFSKFRDDWRSARPLPSVIFLEPEYADAPMSDPNDDHPPAEVSKGQDFVQAVYEAVISNPKRWSKTLLIITYDEHGGFFDHVPPPDLPCEVEGVPLRTLGPRVPAFLVSPFVGAGEVFSERLDHTSFLQLLADRFGDGSYSPAVEQRQKVLGRIANALKPARAEPAPAMPVRARAPQMKPPSAPSAPNTPNAAGIDAMMRQLATTRPDLIEQPGWSEMRRYLATNSPPVPIHTDHVDV